tara:strand:- start:661 stop:1242 length:582 start_codon:yes stop_codon:yes gene_type:complete
MPTVKKTYSTLAGDKKDAAEKKASDNAGQPLRYDKDLSIKAGAHRFVAAGAKGMRYSAGGRNGDPKKEKESTSPAIGFSMAGTTKKEQKKIDKAAAKEAKAAAKKEAKQEKEDKKGMIPAKYRNRGQAGIDRYIADQRRKKARKKRKGLAKIFGGKAMRQASKKTRKAARAARRRMHASRGSGCQGEGCGAYE